MAVQLVVPGVRTSEQPHDAALRGVLRGDGARATPLLDAVRVIAAFDLSPGTRGEAPEETLPVQDDDILEVELESGFTIWTSVARQRERVQRLRPDAAAGTLRLGGLVEPSAESGLREWTARAVRVLRIDPDGIAERDELAPDSDWAATKRLLSRIEQRLEPGPGLYRCPGAPRGLDLSQQRPLASADLPAEQPMLVLLHGTASSTLGSFGALASAEAAAHWRALSERFGVHIYAFEHRTLSESPLDNAVALAELLPRNAEVHLLSHSRGGMIADLLSLRGLSPQQIERFRRAPQHRQALEHDRARLQQLARLLEQKELRVRRIARVACPASGTLLAHENLDHFLSVLVGLIGRIPGLAGAPLYDVAKRAALEIVRGRHDPAQIPGIEAMLPSSPLVALLNNATASGELGAIAGDIESGGWLQRLAVFVSDRFIFEHQDHDLVVDTRSMLLGPQRETARYVFDQGSDVSHFEYFRNRRTRDALTRWLTEPDLDALGEFTPVASPEAMERLRPLERGRSTTPRPVVFVLPGVMGSHLKLGGDRIWLAKLRLFLGGLGALDLRAERAVEPDSLLDDYYGELCTYLARTHDVIGFAYDWRRSIAHAARRLAEQVASELDRSREPVRIVAHSMGGLVVRKMIEESPELWTRLCERKGARFLMLGTPNRGAHSTIDELIGAARTVRQLALLDIDHGLQEVVDLVARFPGVLELLPHDEERWFEAATWSALRAANRELGALPAGLSDARRVVSALPATIPHAECVHYVAGSAQATPCGLRVQEGALVRDTTPRGDGRVTYASGQLPDVKTWYADAEHGDLPCLEAAFPAYTELLQHGDTLRLARTEPQRRTRDAVQSAPVLIQPVLYPSIEDLSESLMGRRRRALPRRVKRRLAVSVVHGDLRYARYPVMMGHYEGDTIAGVERYLDDHLGGALSQRARLGRYPGPLDSTLVVLRERSSLQSRLGVPRGAIVIGLGNLGDLTPPGLTSAIRKGALDYALQLADRPLEAGAGEELGLTVLLIGASSAASIGIEDSVRSILRGIAQATLELEEQRVAAWIQRVEILECYADAATEAAHVLNQIASTSTEELGVAIQAEPRLVTARGGRTRVSTRSGARYWRRLQVTSAAEQGGGLRYVAFSDRARSEVLKQAQQPELIDSFVRLASADARFRASTARTLGQLLLPNELKDWIRQQKRVVLSVDDATAGYPWELMMLGSEPLCVQTSLVRQLETGTYRPVVRAAKTRRAFVVGAPRTSGDWPALPGARAEGELVRALLSRRYDVHALTEAPGATDVLDGLLAGEPHAIVHLAGHGTFKDAAQGLAPRGGMVLEDGLFLTAAEIAALEQVPELVFLNCCHLGRMQPESRANDTAYNKLAASLARELIDMGVRAVVAAGWAVRDDAARRFASTFYERLLDGSAFGDAVQAARVATWNEYPDSNTWGAYQAYGDPSFRLVTSAADATPAQTDVRAPALVDAAELVLEVQAVGREALAAPARSDVDRERARAVVQLDRFWKDCADEWRGDAELLSAFARAYGDTGSFEKGIEFFERALATGGGELALVEQLANLEVRFGRRARKRAPIEKAIRRLETLLELGETAERRALLGSAWRGLAQIATRGAAERVPEHLRRAQEQYRRAAALADQKLPFDPYPRLSRLKIEAVLKEVPGDVAEELRSCESAALQRFARDRGFWDAVVPADVMLIELLRAAPGEPVIAQIVKLYQHACDAGAASPREIESAWNDLEATADFMQAVQPGMPATDAMHRILAALDPSRGAAPAASSGPEPARKKPRGTAKSTRRRRAPEATG